MGPIITGFSPEKLVLKGADALWGEPCYNVWIRIGVSYYFVLSYNNIIGTGHASAEGRGDAAQGT